MDKRQNGRVRRLAVGALAIGAALALCGKPALAILYGRIDSGNVYSEVGTICGVDKASGDLFNFCSAVLVHPRVVVTAGHVSRAIENSIAHPDPDGTEYFIEDKYISFSPTDWADRGTWNQCSAVRTHPLYRGSPLVNDIGVLVLKDPVPGITPAGLPSAAFLDSLVRRGILRSGRSSLTVVGYGRFVNQSGRVKEGDGNRRFGQSRFSGLRTDWVGVVNGRGGTGSAPGDSGGGTFFSNPDGSRMLVGVISNTDDGIDYQARTDSSKAVSFLQDILRRVDAGRL